MERTANPERARTLEDLLPAGVIREVGRLDVSSRRVFAGKLKGERRSKRRGESVEFADHRPYSVGDDLRRIDWNIFGRLDRMFLKMFMEEEDLGLHVVVDASGSSDAGEPAGANKFLFMQRAAMALGYVGLVNLNRVACTVMGGRAPGEAEGSAGAVRSARDLRGRTRTVDLARFLCGVEPWGVLDFRRAAERIAASRRGKGVMVVLSDFFFKDGYEGGLRLLSGGGYEVYCVQVLSPQELDPGVRGDVRLVDVEDGDAAEVTVSAPLLKRYGEYVRSYTGALSGYCRKIGAGYVLASSGMSVDRLLVDELRRRGALA
ncbi:MAG: DUF58 domain-containing protein [Phycisphaeraceae bacterium]|nr:MAG: DUF58 domain-containing protein [Phycisphaeraceae bacterium]